MPFLFGTVRHGPNLKFPSLRGRSVPPTAVTVLVLLARATSLRSGDLTASMRLYSDAKETLGYKVV
jgi:hypothetical protein